MTLRRVTASRFLWHIVAQHFHHISANELNWETFLFESLSRKKMYQTWNPFQFRFMGDFPKSGYRKITDLTIKISKFSLGTAFSFIPKWDINFWQKNQNRICMGSAGPLKSGKYRIFWTLSPCKSRFPICKVSKIIVSDMVCCVLIIEPNQ